MLTIARFLSTVLLSGRRRISDIMLGDATLAAKVAEPMLAKGVYVIGFSYPVVPLGKARIGTQEVRRPDFQVRLV